MKRMAILICALALAGCSAGSSPSPVPAKDCVGDINGDGLVTVDEMQAITLLKYNNIPNDGALKATDVNGDGVIDDQEYSMAVVNSIDVYAAKCQYVK